MQVIFDRTQGTALTDKTPFFLPFKPTRAGSGPHSDETQQRCTMPCNTQGAVQQSAPPRCPSITHHHHLFLSAAAVPACPHQSAAAAALTTWPKHVKGRYRFPLDRLGNHGMQPCSRPGCIPSFFLLPLSLSLYPQSPIWLLVLGPWRSAIHLLPPRLATRV